MIVTRQRKKKFKWGKLILPVLAIGLVIFAILWGPSRGIITNGPMAPVWRVAGNVFGTIAAPFHFAAQNEVITDRNRQIAVLQEQLAAAQTEAQNSAKKVTDLQTQIDQLQSQAASNRTASPKPAAAQTAASSAAGGFPSGSQVATAGDLSTGATADMKRTAQYWASMDPDNAAKIAQRLPPGYVARIFAQMQPDAVAPILDALPASYAAKLSQENPGLQR